LVGSRLAFPFRAYKDVSKRKEFLTGRVRVDALEIPEK